MFQVTDFTPLYSNQMAGFYAQLLNILVGLFPVPRRGDIWQRLDPRFVLDVPFRRRRGPLTTQLGERGQRFIANYQQFYQQHFVNNAIPKKVFGRDVIPVRKQAQFRKLRRLIFEQNVITQESVKVDALPQFYALDFRMKHSNPSQQTRQEVNAQLGRFQMMPLPQAPRYSPLDAGLIPRRNLLQLAVGPVYRDMVLGWCGKEVMRHWDRVAEQFQTQQLGAAMNGLYAPLGQIPPSVSFQMKGGYYLPTSRIMDGKPRGAVKGQVTFSFDLDIKLDLTPPPTDQQGNPIRPVIKEKVPQQFKHAVNALITVGLLSAWVPVLANYFIAKYGMTVSRQSWAHAARINQYLAGNYTQQHRKWDQWVEQMAQARAKGKGKVDSKPRPKQPQKRWGQQTMTIYLTPSTVVDDNMVRPLQWKVNTGTLATQLQKTDNISRSVTDAILPHWRSVAYQYWQKLRDKEQKVLQQYQSDTQSRGFIGIKNIYVTFKTYIPSDYMVFEQDPNANAQTVAIQLAVRSGRGPPKPAQLPGLVDWQFFGRRNRAMISQFQVLQPQCLQKLAVKLADNGYPVLQTTPQQALKDIVRYCAVNQVSYGFIGFPQRAVDFGSSVKVIMGPRHVDLLQVKKVIPRGNLPLAFFKKVKQQPIVYKDFTGGSRKQIANWRLGDELPLDPQLDRNQKKLRTRSLVIDIQALSVTQQTQTPYMICAVGYPYQGDIFYRCWSNIQIYDPTGQQVRLETDISRPVCISLFVEWLAQIVHEYTPQFPLTIWGYNAMGYEIVYLIKELTILFGVVQMLGQPSQCKSFSVGQGRIIFADIEKILPVQALSKACKQFKVIIAKQDFNIALYSTWEDVRKNYRAIRQYCFIDCVSTLLLVHKTQCGFLKIAQDLAMPMEIQTLTRKITAAGLGWSFFIQGFLKRNIFQGDRQNTPASVYNNEPQQVYHYQRKSYTGGVVQVYQYAHIGRVYVVDINSMYPAMLLRDMPWRFQGEFKQGNLEAILSQDDSSMYLFQITFYELPAEFLGAFIATKQVGQLGKNTYYNAYQGQPMYMRGVTLKRLLHHNGKVRWTRGWRYSSGGVTAFRQFAQTFYQKRLQTTSSSLKTCYKLLMNSVIGRCSMGPKSRYRSTLMPKEDNYFFLDGDHFLQIDPQELPAVGKLVRLTAYITDAAKCYLDQLAQKAGYTNVLYCDTDSLMVTQEGFKQLGSPGTKATLLGEFKCEGPSDGKDIFYTQGYFKNRKDYILKYETKQGKVSSLYKAKGIPRKFITRQYTQSIIACFMGEMPRILKAPSQTKVIIGNKVRMEVWRKQFGGQPGVIIQEMMKSSSVIVDRWHDSPYTTGIPRSGPSSVFEINDIEDHCL